jgi:predicted site-specific integrase-resolvase
VTVHADEESLVTGAQAARRLGLSRNAVHKWYYEGRLKRTEDGLYRYREVQTLEKAMRATGMVHRGARVLVAA